ncbi:MAG: ATP-binding protein [Acidimicrobiales bacterium]|jgi:two-component sensor histidine kinase
MRYSSRLPAVKESVTVARDFVLGAVGTMSNDVRDAVMVVTSELTSNCVRHGASSFEVTIEQFPDRIVIEVEDDSDGEPVMRSPGPTETSGRGLQITQALAETWGVRRDRGSVGKTVWAVVRTSASDARQLTSEPAVQAAPTA